MTPEELKAKARHEIDTPGHPDYGKAVYTFTEQDLNALLMEELIAYDKWLSKNNWGIGMITPEQSVDNYLKSQQ